MSSPRILYFDIESAPNLAYVWGQYDQNVIAHEHEWTMLCFSYQWEGDRSVKVVSNYHDFGTTTDDSGTVAALWKLFDEADIVIAHNGDKFDIRKANARFVQQGLGAPSPFRSIDTLKVARRHFAFNSNKLDDLGQHLGLGEKVKHPGWRMWEGCLAGDKKWWDLMRRYAKQDIVLLRDVYRVLRPFMSNHPNLANYSEEAFCPSCGAGEEHAKRGGTYHTQTGKYQCLRCDNCGTSFRALRQDSDGFRPTTTAVTRR